MKTLWDHGFEAAPPKGAYYVMAGIGHLGLGDDTATARHLTTQIGVAVVPGSSFYAEPERGHGARPLLVQQAARHAARGRLAAGEAPRA